MMRFKWTTLLVITLLLVAACGGGEEQVTSAEAAQGAATEESASAGQEEEMTPTALGDKIIEIYVQGLNDVTALMADRPAAADLQPKVDELKESYITKLVELGAKRAALSEADQATVNLQVRIGISGVPSDTFAAYSEGQMHYQKTGDRELAKTIADFNVITQYADFELLKQQTPAEAERLGIE